MKEAQPALPDLGVLALGPDGWGAGPWTTRHQVLTRLAEYFHVVWVDPAEEWRQAWGSGALRTNQDTEPALPAGFHVYRASPWLPRLYRPALLAEFTRNQRLKRAQRILNERGAEKTVLYLWRPEFDFALRKACGDVSCYHIDDEYTFDPVERPTSPRELSVIASVDQVIIHSHTLMRKKGGINPHTAYVPNGVDFAAYATPVGEPGDLAAIPHPRIGYVGVIKQQLDMAFLQSVVDANQHASFVFVGPLLSLGDQAASVEALARRKNVYFLGPKPVGELPAYTQHFDVCFMCYKINDYTKFICPVKLHEYLASGRPVVASPIPALLEFADVVTLARTEQEWSQALRASLLPSASSPERVEARHRVARCYDWRSLVSTIARVFCERLGPSYASRLDQVLEGAAAVFGVGGSGPNRETGPPEGSTDRTRPAPIS